MKLTFLYILLEPFEDEVRYVGKSDRPLERLTDHLNECKNETHRRANWLKSLKYQNLKPRLEILCEVPAAEWEFWERHFIKYFRACGFDLVNTTLGGDGVHLEGQPNPFFGKKHSEESKLKNRLAHLGKRASVETRAKQSAALKGRKCSAAECAARSERMRGAGNPRFGKPGTLLGKPMSEITRAKVSAAKLGTIPHNKGKKASAEARENIKRAQQARRARERITCGA